MSKVVSSIDMTEPRVRVSWAYNFFQVQCSLEHWISFCEYMPENSGLAEYDE